MSFFCEFGHKSLIILFLLIAHINAYSLESTSNLLSRDIAKGVTAPLRILPLGASITYGLRSTDGNGYRYALRGKLIADGNDVNMIGVKDHGNMSNNAVSGFPGYRIDQIAKRQNLSLTEEPNIVLLEIGTNDMSQDYDVDTAHVRLGSLVGRILNASPNVTVIVGTLLPNANANTEANILTFNANLPSTIANLSSQGYKVSLVDFHSDWWSLDDIGPDGTHPTDMGYLKMSRVWYMGILEAAKSGNVTAPRTVSGIDDYAAGNDTTAAHTAMNVVCQNVNGSVSAQVQACSTSSKGSMVGINTAYLAALLLAVSYVL